MAARPPSSFRFRVLRLLRHVGARAAAFGLIAVLFALAAGVIGSLLPVRVQVELGQNSVGSLLQIIATAMLTATTFSITAMVTAYSSATTGATPRAAQLLVADRTAQNSLSTFVGAFVFAMVGIVALSTGYYTEQGRIILFLGTLVIIVVIVVTLMRWIAHLAQFGRMADTIDRVESAASEALTAYAARPTLGARRLDGVPPTAAAVGAERVGYVVHVDLAELQRLAEAHRGRVFVLGSPGRSVDATRPLCHVTWRVDDDTARAVRQAFTVASHRTYEQDPRIGVIALCEIGTRALSRATNDPGTAIEVVAALHRVFDRALRTERDDAVDFDRVHLEAPRLETIVHDAFPPLARDGASILEVQVRLQKALAALAAVSPGRASVFTDSARAALQRARRAMPHEDYRALRTTAALARRAASAGRHRAEH